MERFNRILLEEWAYARVHTSETERRAALPGWLHTYNHQRCHTAFGGHPSVSRIPSLTGQNNWSAGHVTIRGLANGDMRR